MDFNKWLKSTILDDDKNGRLEKLQNWESAPGARASHPREEHLLPLLMVAAAGGEDAPATLIYDTMGKFLCRMQRRGSGTSDGWETFWPWVWNSQDCMLNTLRVKILSCFKSRAFPASGLADLVIFGPRQTIGWNDSRIGLGHQDGWDFERSGGRRCGQVLKGDL
jgi:hypothetical protein